MFTCVYKIIDSGIFSLENPNTSIKNCTVYKTSNNQLKNYFSSSETCDSPRKVMSPDILPEDKKPNNSASRAF